MRILPLLSLVVLLLVGCSPKPDASIILWEQPSPQIVAQNHAQEIGGRAYVVISGSMMPYFSIGDWIVVDYRVEFDMIKPGSFVNFQPWWNPAPNHTVTHMAVEKTGDAWITTGTATRTYQGGSMAMTRREYCGSVDRVYTKRKKL